MNEITNADAQEESVVRETRARSRAVAEENQPPARSTRSNRDSTPDNNSSRRADSAGKRSSIGGKDPNGLAILRNCSKSDLLEITV